MLVFCPSCSSSLMIEDSEDYTYQRLSCYACPYISDIKKKISSKIFPKLKEIDQVLGGVATWENVDSTDAECLACSHKRAYFMQVQTRSADEPMTTFYKCCNHQYGQI